MENNSELFYQLAAEKTMRNRLEEELSKMQSLIIVLEGQLKSRSSEVSYLKVELEKSNSELQQQSQIFRNDVKILQEENEKLKENLKQLRSEYFRASDQDIQKTTKIDELYGSISEFQDDIRGLTIHIGGLQREIEQLNEENRRLVNRLGVKKESKFVQADPSPLTSSIGRVKSPSTHSTNILSLTRTKSQILSLQKEKQRLDMQIHLLSKFA
jgi:chromosome segregation ATPase